MLLHLRKCLYGLKQSFHIWYGTFKDFLISIGFVASHFDAGLLVVSVKDKGTVVAMGVLYVNDIFIIANEDLIRQINDLMTQMIRMHHLRSVSFHLGYDHRTQLGPSQD